MGESKKYRKIQLINPKIKIWKAKKKKKEI